MTTPLFDSVLGEVLQGAHVARDRLATARAGIDRLHGPDAHERCPLCREAWPCATRRLIDGLSRGDLDAGSADGLVDDALRREAASGEADLPTPSRIPALSDLLDAGRTGKALDLLLGRGQDARER